MDKGRKPFARESWTTCSKEKRGYIRTEPKWRCWWTVMYFPNIYTSPVIRTLNFWCKLAPSGPDLRWSLYCSPSSCSPGPSREISAKDNHEINMHAVKTFLIKNDDAATSSPRPARQPVRPHRTRLAISNVSIAQWMPTHTFRWFHGLAF
jgi:hypothetical protein